MLLKLFQILFQKVNFHCFTGPNFDFQGGWFTTAKTLRKSWPYILIEEHFIIFLYSSNTEKTLPFPLLTLSIVLVAGLLLSLCIAIGQNLFPLSPWLLVIVVYSVLGEAPWCFCTRWAQKCNQGNCNDANHSASVHDLWYQIFFSPALNNKT